MKNKYRWIWGICVSLCAFSTAARAEDVVVEAYGDSLTAGFLSMTSLVDPPDLQGVSKMVNKIYMYGISHDRKFLTPLHAPQDAWPVFFANHFTQAGQPMHVVNQAVSGAVTADLMGQLAAAPASPGKTIAFFFMGHNDMVNRTDSVDALKAQYTRDLDAALSTWDAKHSGSVAYIIPIANVDHAYHLLQGYVWHQTDQGSYSCENSWDMFVYGKTYAQMLKAGTLDGYLNPRIDAIHAAEDQLANDWSKKSNRNHYRYLNDLNGIQYQRDYFAVDCFHMSAEGQQMLGERVAGLVDAKDWQ